jgi:hypothetical protein
MATTQFQTFPHFLEQKMILPKPMPINPNRMISNSFIQNCNNKQPISPSVAAVIQQPNILSYNQLNGHGCSSSSSSSSSTQLNIINPYLNHIGQKQLSPISNNKHFFF